MSIHSMPSRLPAAMLVVACLLSTHATVRGQGLIGSTTSSGMFGGRSLSGGTSMGGRTFGGSGAGSSRLGGSSIGMGTGGMGNTGITASRDGILTSRAARAFIGGGNQSGETFVGVSQAGAGPGRRQSFTQGLRPGGGTGASNVNQGGSTPRRNAGDVRTKLNVAFDYPKASSVRAQADLSARMAKMQGIRRLSGLRIAVADGTATLRGVVATDYDRILVERLSRLEPGIWQVKNELVVAQGPAEPEEPPTPAAEPPSEVNTSAPPFSLDLPPEPALPPASPAE